MNRQQDFLSDNELQVKALWGDTAAFREFEEKTAGQSEAQMHAAGAGLMEILSRFGELKDRDVSDVQVQQNVQTLQTYITEHFYTCTKEILRGLGALYAAGGAFTENIDRVGGEGTALFVSQAIEY